MGTAFSVSEGMFTCVYVCVCVSAHCYYRTQRCYQQRPRPLVRLPFNATYATHAVYHAILYFPDLNRRLVICIVLGVLQRAIQHTFKMMEDAQQAAIALVHTTWHASLCGAMCLH